MTIEELKNSLSRKFRGASLDDVQGITNFTLFSEAAGNLLSMLDPIETVRVHRFNVFQGVTEYEPPEQLKGNKLIDPRPQDQRNGEEYAQTYSKEISRDEQFGQVNIGFIDGDKVLRIVASGKTSRTVDQTQDTSDWTAGGGASSLALDSVIRMDNSDTLRVALGAAGGYIEGAAIDQVDLSDDEDISSFFRKIYLPDGAPEKLTSISLIIGSSSTAYWTIPGVPHFGDFREGINQIRFDWEDAVETLAPSASAVDYEKLLFVTTDTIANVRIGPLSSKLPTPYETPYYSSTLFRDTSGDWIDAPEDESDEVVLEKESENIYFYECCQLIAEDLGNDAEAAKYKFKLYGDPQKENDDGGLYGQYKRDKPTETLRPHTGYMAFRNRRRLSRRARLRG